MNLEAFQSIALSVANEKSVDIVLGKIVQGLSQESNIALSRIWLLAPGDICNTCPMRKECKDQSVCLHLAASEGYSLNSQQKWNQINGTFRRFPLGIRKVGQIAKTGEPFLLTNIEQEPDWLRDMIWVKEEKLKSFAGQPLIFRGEILGVLALFSRINMTTQDLGILRTFADGAASAIANAKAFEEIDRLHQQLAMENEYLREEVRGIHATDNIIGQSSALKKLLQQIELVAPTTSTVLIQGESGTGKELIARAIHERSLRKEAPLIKVNCASIPRDLFESEFFGHIKGAFNGAIKDRTGRFKLADQGTLFLDEVGEIPLELQSKLLRILQEGEFERIGEEKSQKVNVRIITATNRDLKKEVQQKRFRQDLYFRLSVFPIEVMSLRERPEDIPELAQYFVQIISKRLGSEVNALTQEQLLQLQNYQWPGNIRELQNTIERAIILAKKGFITFDLPSNNEFKSLRIKEQQNWNLSQRILTFKELKELEKTTILNALEQTNWKISGPNGAAQLLGAKPTTLASRMKVMEIKRPLE